MTFKPVVINGEILFYDIFDDNKWLGSHRTLEQCKSSAHFYENYEAIIAHKEEEKKASKEEKLREKEEKVQKKLQGDHTELKEIIKKIIDGGFIGNADRISDWIVGQVMKNHKGKYDPTVIKHIATDLMKK